MQRLSVLLRWIPAVLYAAALFFLSSRPVLGSGPWFPGADKIVHALAYAVLAVLIRWALGGGTWLTSVLAAGLAAVYGISDEYHQSFVPGRMADVWDVVADAVGASVGVVLAGIWETKRGRGSG